MEKNNIYHCKQNLSGKWESVKESDFQRIKNQNLKLTHFIHDELGRGWNGNCLARTCLHLLNLTKNCSDIRNDL